MLDFLESNKERIIRVWNERLSGEHPGLGDLVKPHLESISLTQKEAWVAHRFLYGYVGLLHLDHLTQWDRVYILPTSPTVSTRAITLSEDGVKEFIERTGLCFETVLEPYDSSLRGAREEGNEVESCTRNNLFDDRIKRGFKGFHVFVSDAEFIKGDNKRVCGISDHVEAESSLVLARGVSRGRYQDGIGYLPMTPSEREEYFKTIVVHETRHMIGLLPDKIGEDTLPWGYTLDPHCLGISKFVLPVNFCDFCLDGIRAFWYGVEERTGKEFLRK